MKYLTVSSRQIASVRRWSIAPARRPPCCIDPASVPQGVYQFSDRVHDPATDSEQDHPYQIVDLLSEIGNSKLHCLRSPEEDGSQDRMIGIAATRIVISLYTRDAHQCGSRRSCSRSLLRWTLPVAVRGRSRAISNRRGR